MDRPLIIGVMGGGIAAAQDTEAARRLGALIAGQGWILLNGGRNAGIMEASAKGAAGNGGITVGILPDDHLQRASEFIQIPILTGMGNARNCINVLSSSVVVACPGGAGTLSEIALALKNEKPVVLMNFELNGMFETYRKRGLLVSADTPEAVIEQVKSIVKTV
jgi:uncharacterized protein (TIGR00725 family)